MKKLFFLITLGAITTGVFADVNNQRYTLDIQVENNTTNSLAYTETMMDPSEYVTPAILNHDILYPGEPHCTPTFSAASNKEAVSPCFVAHYPGLEAQGDYPASGLIEYALNGSTLEILFNWSKINRDNNITQICSHRVDDVDVYIPYLTVTQRDMYNWLCHYTIYESLPNFTVEIPIENQTYADTGLTVLDRFTLSASDQTQAHVQRRQNQFPEVVIEPRDSNQLVIQEYVQPLTLTTFTGRFTVRKHAPVSELDVLVYWTRSTSGVITCREENLALGGELYATFITTSNNSCELLFYSSDDPPPGTGVQSETVTINNPDSDQLLRYNFTETSGEFSSEPPETIIETDQFDFETNNDGQGLQGSVTYLLEDNVYYGSTNALRFDMSWQLPNIVLEDAQHQCEAGVFDAFGIYAHPKYQVTLEKNNTNNVNFECAATITKQPFALGIEVEFVGEAVKRDFVRRSQTTTPANPPSRQAEFETLLDRYEWGGAVAFEFYTYDPVIEQLIANVSYDVTQMDTGEIKGHFTLYTRTPDFCSFDPNSTVTTTSGSNYTIHITKNTDPGSRCNRDGATDGLLFCCLEVH